MPSLKRGFLNDGNHNKKKKKIKSNVKNSVLFITTECVVFFSSTEVGEKPHVVCSELLHIQKKNRGKKKRHFSFATHNSLQPFN